jgi:hypothetical protein
MPHQLRRLSAIKGLLGRIVGDCNDKGTLKDQKLARE